MPASRPDAAADLLQTGNAPEGTLEGSSVVSLDHQMPRLTQIFARRRASTRQQDHCEAQGKER